MGRARYIHIRIRINGTLKYKQHGRHGIQYPHDIDIPI